MAVVVPISEALAELLGKPETIYVGGQPLTPDEALAGAEHLAVCFSASYCPSCRLFMPALEYAYRQGRLEHRCKVLLVGGDKTAEAFDAYRSKYSQFLSLSWDANQHIKASMREKWKIATIPHVVLLECQYGNIVKPNVRFQIEEDPRCKDFPWTGQPIVLGTVAQSPSPEGVHKHWTFGERFWKKPRCYQLGHKVKDGSQAMYMDESAVRARAGLLNITSWFALVNILFWKESLMLKVFWPVVAWDMFSAAAFGLTPLSPYGILGMVLAYFFGPAEPHWKPAGPKRFAWVIGFLLVNTCGLAYLLQAHWLMMTAALMCNMATWAESALGFCVGCWVWNGFIAPHLNQQACQECKL